MSIILQCPVCRNPLLLSADGFHCIKNHSFDASREGYVNLLLAHRKHSKEPGDSREMIQSRRRFLDLGLYAKISDGINEAITANLPASPGPIHILDAGCGEGYYLKRLKDHLANLAANSVAPNFYGVDISKFAVRQAARRDKTMNWFVAGINELPFANNSLDLILNVFSPAVVPEFDRLLRENSALVMVGPGPNHLNGLREIIYPEAREHKPSSAVEAAGTRFLSSAKTRITYPLELSSHETIMDLLAMTPYFWNIDLKTKAKVESLGQLKLDVDVEIRTFRKKGLETGTG